jgi:hypothetical protein
MTTTTPSIIPTANDNVELLPAAREMLAALWARAMNNDATPEEIEAIRVGCVAVAVAKHGIEGVGPFPDWQHR